MKLTRRFIYCNYRRLFSSKRKPRLVQKHPFWRESVLTRRYYCVRATYTPKRTTMQFNRPFYCMNDNARLKAYH